MLYISSLLITVVEYDVITEGDYEQLLENSEHFFVYRRHWQNQTLTVICGFNHDLVADNEVAPYCGGRQLLKNYDRVADGTWQPFETRVYLTQK